jgi:hypothetical protein
VSEGVLKGADVLESVFEGDALMPESHVETGPVWARWLMTVREGHVFFEVSALVVRREPSAWLAVARVLVGIVVGPIVPVLVVGTDRGTLVLARVSCGTQLVSPGDTLRRALSDVMASEFGWRIQAW